MSEKRSSGTKLMLGAVGVVFGDIGTSPLYTLRECLKAAGPLTEAHVLGILSLIVWSILMVVTVKYVAFVMQADNNREGGILALTALASQVAPARMRFVLVTLGLFGAAMFYGDSMITPAISVISAVEGLELINGKFSTWVVPVSLVILAGLFGIQRRGTDAVGKLFGPVMVVWFVTLGVIGLWHVIGRPAILAALLPSHALAFLLHSPGTAFIVLGSVFLAVTGGEALYADMGHFGKPPIRRAWLFLVFPSLVLNYFGQGALVLTTPGALDQPFFKSVPSWGLVPLVLLAGFATVIASQAVISGAFSMTKQAIQLGYLPRIDVLHTSSEEAGQIYVPFINKSLFVAVVFLVLFFRSSDNLAGAYGIAVASTMLLTTFLMYFITHYRWKWRPLASAAVLVPLALIDLIFVSSNLGKVMEGGWFPILAGTALFTLMTTWRRGREEVVERLKVDNLPLESFLPALCEGEYAPERVEGTAVFPNGLPGVTPSAFMHNLKHNRVLHRTNIFLAGTTEPVPYVSDEERLEVKDLGHGCLQAIARHGFMEIPNVPALLDLLTQKVPSWHYDVNDTSFFLARDTIVPTREHHEMWLWREKIFVFLTRNATQAAEYYSLPSNRVIELGGQINV